ncbi:MAG: DUF418 domain-containing protein [Chloroflexales bacterium]|nr:DUF418 domain-containing protein [Chloroflexales bacterium]
MLTRLRTTTAPTSTATPLAAGERLANVDVLRGFALFGILLVNIALFKAPAIVQAAAPAATNALDQLAAQAINLFAEGKFFTLFSFLFGFGVAAQLVRARQHGVPFASRYLRRLLVLLLIGVAHATLLWYGDILVTYALLGFVLILLRDASPRTLLAWSLALLAGMTLLLGAAIVVVELQRADPVAGAAILAAEREQLASVQAEIARDTTLYREGSYWELVAARSLPPVGLIYNLVTQGIPVLAMFLLGMYVGKGGILSDPPAHHALLRRVRLWGLLLGLTLSTLLVFAQTQLSLFAGLGALLLAHSLTGPLLAMGYAATIVLLHEQPRWRSLLAPLGAAGRMALTNYLLQTLVCTTLFYGYGFGLYGQVGAAQGAVLTAVIFVLQVAWSDWWLRRFQFGPVEWLWRTLTYGRAQPIRRNAEAALAR